MARMRLTYLSFTEFDGATDLTSAAVKYGYLGYAAGSWAAHFRKVQQGATEQILDLVFRVCDTRSQRFKTWFNVHWNMPHPQAFGLP